jgi:hypothetical protein
MELEVNQKETVKYGAFNLSTWLESKDGGTSGVHVL